MINLILQLFLGCIAAFGWFFCLGHLLVEKFAPKQAGFAFIFSVSLATSAAFLALVTPWIALPAPIPLIIGIGMALLWAWKKPSIPLLPKIEWTPTFAILVSMLILFGVIIVLFPDTSFDSVSYHIPFMQEFASQGKVDFPLLPENWVDHARLIYPKAIELAFGLSNQLIPGSYQFLQFIILISIALLLAQLSDYFSISNRWAASALFFITIQVLIVAKLFYLELSIFCFFLAFLILVLKQDSLPKQASILLFILSLAITMGKLTSFIYVFSTVLIAFLYFKKPAPFLSVVVGLILGMAGNFLYPLLHGVDILNELSILQALTTGLSLSVSARVYLLLDGIKSLLVPTIIGVGFCLSILLFFFEVQEKKLFHGIIFISFFTFLVAFVFGNLYLHTYEAFAFYYVYTFIGISVLSIPLFFQKLSEKFSPVLLQRLLVLGIILIFISSFSFCFTLIQRFHSGDNLNSRLYYAVVENVPNQSDVVVLFMNNINPTTYGLENTTIYDHTRFPVMSGKPCDFWHANHITHIVYYNPNATSFQLDGGNSEFYLSAKNSILSNECSTLLTDDVNSNVPLVAKITYLMK